MTEEKKVYHIVCTGPLGYTYYLYPIVFEAFEYFKDFGGA